MTTQWQRWRRWLAPGLGIKRWVLVIASGVLVFSAGVSLLVNVKFLAEVDAAVFWLADWLQRITGGGFSPALLGAAGALGGAVIAFLGLRGTLRSIDRVLFPSGSPTLVEVLRDQRRRQRGISVVALGGGTGLSTLLRGLKRYSSNLTAVVTVFDDGGSSGRLRRELGVLPPGDIRDCLVALAEVEPLMTQLFEHRFRGGALDGHAFGNLFIASLVGVTGDLEQAVKETSKVLNIRGRVLPTTVRDVVLVAELDDGRVVEGESQITAARGRIRRVRLRPPEIAPLPDVLAAIADADLILLGPGSLYTSVIPNLLIRSVAEAIRAARGLRVYVCNVMTQPGETDGFTAADHVRAIWAHTGPGLFTHVLVNTRAPQNRALLARYAAEGSQPVAPTLAEIQAMGLVAVGAPLVSEEELLRHDPLRLARAVLDLWVTATGRPPRPRRRPSRARRPATAQRR
ncbi:MAG: YvcK family protein [Armatimonadota bacterium]|nr:YvcK family protein [Armatimonadota bacterium]MDR7535815.1 YvcK family protein [Armatimonadota bacterium]